MPEWPDLHVLRGRIASALTGRRVSGVRVHDPLVLRVTEPLEAALQGRTLREVVHRGRFLGLLFDRDIRLLVNPMLSGLFDLVLSDEKLRTTTAFALTFDETTAAGAPTDLRYRDDTRMGKVYLLAPGASADGVPGFAGQGPEAGELAWSAEEFAQRARAARRELRNLLMDPAFVSGIGNAYSDEILWAARLHPKRRVATLDDGELDRLYGAVRSTLAEAAEIVERELPPELGTKVRSHLRVRGRAGEPCPRCGTRIIRTRHGLDEMFLCPRCQPPPKGQLR